MRYVSVQVCGLLLMLVLLFSGGRAKPIKTRATRAFRNAMYAIIACLVLDMVSVAAIMEVFGSYEDAIETMCKIYLISIIAVGVMMHKYLIIGCPKNDIFSITSKLTGYAAAAISLYFIISSPIQVCYDAASDHLYTDGPSALAAYVGMAIMIVVAFCSTFVLRSIRKEKLACMRLWAILMMLCGTIQLFNRDLLITGFAMSLGAAVIFVRLEGPNRYTNMESGLYNSVAFNEYVAERYSLSYPAYLIRIAVNSDHKDLSVKEAQGLVKMFSEMLRRTSGLAFRTSSYSFAVVCSSPNSLAMAVDDIEKAIREADANLMLPGIKNMVYVIKDPSMFHSAEEMVSFYYKLKTYKPSHDDVVNIVNINEDIVSKILLSEQVRNDISSALEENRVEVFYQPIYDTRTKLFSSAEALVRIRARDGSIVPPSEIIPVAEESGLIIPLGERVFSLVCGLLGSDKKPAGLKYIEVNLSAVQCRHEMLYNTFSRIMNSYGVKPGQINLEITETARLNTSQKTMTVFNNFRKDGISFSLDDFGTGNSNIDYVANMPMISIIKFDHSMTSGFFTNERIRAVFPYIISMVKDMGLEIVCEGIETKEHLETMAEYGVEYIQGYYFSKPLPEAEFIAFMKEKNNSAAM